MAAVTRRDRLRSQKHALVDRANAIMMTTIAITSVIVVFSFFAGKALIGQYSYQNKVIGQKKDTLKQVKQNSKNADQLVASYKAFATEPINILGGDPNGSGPKDGDNPRIVLDALPSQYDFPGLISSLEKLLVGGGYRIDSIGGTEQPDLETEATGTNPTVVEIPFPIAIAANYGDVQRLVSMLESSIRPIYINTMTLSGTDADMRLTLDAKTFYQPEKKFDVTSEVVK